MSSGQLAKLVGVSPDTLRLYERKGLLQPAPRSANGYRRYPPQAIGRVRVIRAALSIGFTIDELAGIFALRDRGGAPCAQVRDLAVLKLQNLERHLRQLAELRDQLRTVLKQWDSVLRKTPHAQRAGLLEALAAAPHRRNRQLLPQLYPSLSKPISQGAKPMNRKSTLLLLVTLAALVLGAPGASSQEASAPSSHSSHNSAGKDSKHACPMTMEGRGDKGMGFAQAKTTHHFLLKPDGGVIRVEANDGKDTESRDQIRMHLSHIAQAFAQGDFDIPMFVHDQTPPGVPVMQAMKDQITYRFETTENGGRVVISTNDREARSAIHDFLRFQIREHATGDPAAVQ